MMCAALALLLAVTPATVVRGVVRAERSLEPISSARIDVRALGRTVYADARGYFVLPDIPAGRWEVEASALGYRTNALTIVSSGSGVIQLDFELAVRPVELRPLSARARTVGDLPGATASTAETAGPAPVRLSGDAMLKQVPGLAEPDVLRAVQLLPSVAALSDFSSALYIRGGASDQTLITLDGMPLFNPYHLGGVFSAVGADAVASVDVWSGALPARAGDRLSSAVDINARDGARDETHASGNIGLISTHGTVDGPLPGGRGSYLVSGRRTYIDAVSHGAHKLGILKTPVPYGFSDIFLHASNDVGTLGKLTLSAYIDHEGVSMPKRDTDPFGDDASFGWGSRMAAVSFRHPVARSMMFNARAGYSDFDGRFDLWTYTATGVIICDRNGCNENGVPHDTTHELDATTHMRDLVGEAALTWYLRGHELNAGLRYDGYNIAHDLRSPSLTLEVAPPFSTRATGRTVAAHIEDSWHIGAFDMRLGLRALDAGRLGSALLPRFGLRYQLSNAVSVSAGGGRYAQALRSMRDDESALAGLIAYDLQTLQPQNVGLATATDIVIGAEWHDARTSLRVDGYAKRMNNLVLALESADPLDAPLLVLDSFRIGSGLARGIEVLAHRTLGRLDLGVSYALSSSTRSTGDDTYAPRFERRHLLDATAFWKVGERGTVSARLALGSGQPFTPAIGVANRFYYDPGSRSWQNGYPIPVLGEHNSARMPGYSRIDVAFRKSYMKHWFGQDMTVSPYLQVLNVTNSKNVLLPEAQTFNGRPRFQYWPQMPRLPSFGMEWKF